LVDNFHNICYDRFGYKLFSIKMYKLTIAVQHPNIELMLYKNSKRPLRMVQTLVWQDQNNLSLKLLERIDEILRKEGISIEQVGDFETITSQASYTSSRIVRSVLQTFRYVTAH